jgi:hypothetical protein
MNMWIIDFDEKESLELAKLNSEVFGLEEIAASLVLELERELSPNHHLKGSKFTVLAKHKSDPNVFLFKTDHPAYPKIEVHLTWCVEESQEFPNIIKC